MKHLRLLLLVGMVAFAQLLSAQTPPPGGGGGGNTTDAPVDGASGLLLISAVAYGYNKLRKQDASLQNKSK